MTFKMGDRVVRSPEFGETHKFQRVIVQVNLEDWM